MNEDWYRIPTETKIRAYTQVAEDVGIPIYVAEKDWWLVQVLSLLLETKIGGYLTFKGGTSLSKAWNLIERFSEDIDLYLSREFYEVDDNLTRKQIKKLRRRNVEFIRDNLVPEIDAIFKKYRFNDVKVEYIAQDASDADPVKVEIHFPKVIDYPGYVPSRILLEISSCSLDEPKEERLISSFLDEFYFESDFAEGPIKFPTVTPDRTFLEKIFLLHEEFQRLPENIRIERQSRHLYDIYKMLGTDLAKSILENKELYESTVNHRYSYFRKGGVDYNLHEPSTINPIPPPAILEKYKEDYRKMQEEMIYGDAPNYDQLILKIRDFTENSINKINWEWTLNFDPPAKN